MMFIFFFFSSRRRHTRYWRDWSSDVCSSDLDEIVDDGIGLTAARCPQNGYRTERIDHVYPALVPFLSIIETGRDRKSTRLNSSHANISYAVFCLKKKKKEETNHVLQLHQ